MLPDEPIANFSGDLAAMAGQAYMDTQRVQAATIAFLREMRGKLSVNCIVDCFPPCIGRDIGMMRVISREAGVHIVASTGFCLMHDNPVRMLKG